MGLGSSKLETPEIEAPSVDLSAAEKAAFVPLQQVQAQEAELASQIEETRQQAQQKLGEVGAQLASATTWSNVYFYGGTFLFLGLIALAIVLVHDLVLAPKYGWTPWMIPASSSGGGGGGGGGVGSTGPVTQKSNPPLITRLTNYVTGSDSSGDLVSSLHDATTSSSISATNAPLSNQNQGAYGVQWWMFVKDWNYGYGKDKSVLVRADPTNAAVMNPSISLHPTDNTLKVSISIFPNNSSASKTEPAPATGSGSSTDDVFICEVPNIPLQAWFSVSVSVFGKNADIYIDGKLVKSCMLPGVPKPAVGDIQLSPNGGFSGYICNVYHYPRMLTPSDAMTFYSAGSTCSNDVSSSGVSAPSLSGYSIKFGVYDTLGKEVQQYTF